MGIAIFITFLLLLALGVPIIFVLGLTSAIYMILSGTPLIALAQRMFVGMDSFVLMAIPFYILVGNLMSSGDITRQLVKWCRTLVGHIPGGLAHVNVLASVLFAGISGSASADTSAVGGILIPAMVEEGYDVDFSCAVTVASSCLSPIIPPSIVFVVYAVVAEVSIAEMFMAGIVPGLIMAALQMVVIVYFSRKRNYPISSKRATFKEMITETGRSVPVLLGPVIILAGILSGAVTPTEAGVIAVAYVGILAFSSKKVTLRDLPGILLSTVTTTAGAYLIVAMASAFAWILTVEQVPQTIAHTLLSGIKSPLAILVLINMLLLVVGTFMEAVSALIILVPILLPIATAAGIDPVHLGVVMSINLIIGFITPPVGTCLFIASGISKISVERISRAVLPFLASNIAALLLTTFSPSISLSLPRLILK